MRSATAPVRLRPRRRTFSPAAALAVMGVITIYLAVFITLPSWLPSSFYERVPLAMLLTIGVCGMLVAVWVACGLAFELVFPIRPQNP
jgi:hypothetical protein